MDDVRVIADRFGRAAQSYDAYAQVQARVSHAVAAMMPSYVAHGSIVVDVGAGTGAIARCAPDYAWLHIDASEAMCGKISAGERLCADGRALPLRDGSMDGYVSSMAWQWMHPLDATIREMQRVLRHGGYAIIATLIAGTLGELAEAFRCSGVESPLLTYPSAASLSELLIQHGCAIHHHALETHRMHDGDAYAMLRSLKQIGAIAHKRAPLSVAEIRAVCRAYPQCTDGGVVSSYQVGWWVVSRRAR
ncbi:MAG: methyltransferase domain-containing protein [Alphaproteobacteria bacterium]|nr:MAG: methyltransferase domain-containing protein [Alphaproteobacteria bacterium]TAF15068.1 MAG: methyltransferase domain-containing protein [Alphaproteobacteria bacterium]TAF40474.1 MAG: methyltransferase domain-containing protein [Alphaproteobacteria bacterium]TAF76905.1 MAG: methyltransferase domain-containing protein [Alphaproteobacteria bacterium]